MNQKTKKQAIITLVVGIVLMAVGFIIDMLGLFNVYGLAGPSTGCNGSCTNHLAKDTLMVHIGGGFLIVGNILFIVGLVAIIFLSIRKKKFSRYK